MQVLNNRIADMHSTVTEWRQDLHKHPELLFDVHRTAEFVAGKLKEFGVDEIVTGLGRTGVVGVIHGKSNRSGRVIGLRADMDALPIVEETGKPYASTHEGKMHACGHDGHTAMLLGASKYLSEMRNFDGTVVVIFQPAEEGGGGGREMVQDGMMERFGIQEVYGMHNTPSMPVGKFGIRAGSIFASVDNFRIQVNGKGGHAARPHFCGDPVVTACAIVMNAQSIVSRNVDPLSSAVVSICTINGGTTHNVIPQSVELIGTVRTLTNETRDLAEKRLCELVHSTAAAFGMEAEVRYNRDYPVTFNHAAYMEFAADAAASMPGIEVNRAMDPIMAGEDFAYMLEARPGAIIFIGQGDGPGLHNPRYDFNDEIIPIGINYWAKLVEHRLG
ncbi:amidohydrolase [Bradyrhizobium sp. AZCC 2262]|uniref:M20 aminoacylase family protein n=1 Tax=Bradyrhizobium sp. AZCC 2262 TaxID=3117022 RepID=UPI002FF0C76F